MREHERWAAAFVAVGITGMITGKSIRVDWLFRYGGSILIVAMGVVVVLLLIRGWQESDDC